VAVARIERVAHEEVSVRRLLRRLGAADRLRVCYEAGCTGYELHRLITGMGIDCVVIAPSLVPRRPGDRVKTDRRDAAHLAAMLAAGQLTAVHVPTPAEEAVRDLCRARGAAVAEVNRARKRCISFLLRHGLVYRDGSTWTDRHRQWLAAQRLPELADQSALEFYRGQVAARAADLAAVSAALGPYMSAGPFADAVARLAAYRGVAELGALSLASEVVDWARFPSAAAFMGYTGLVPSEYSSGGSVARGAITRAGNAHLRAQLVESAWCYRHAPAVGVTLARRHNRVFADTVARSWVAQQRLNARFRALSGRKTHINTVAVAVARELAGFLWAEMTA
jgi:transposase